MADGDGITDIVDRSGNGMGVALNVYPVIPEYDVSVTSRAKLATLVPPFAVSAYLRESGREGTFVFDPSDLSAEVASDPYQGVYVAPSSDPTGASGAWVRPTVNGIIMASWFGLGGSDNAARINSAQSLSIARAILLPEGTTLLEKAVVLYSNRTLAGAGEGITILKLASGYVVSPANYNAVVSSFSGSVNVTVRDLSLDGSKINTTGSSSGRQNGVRFTGTVGGLCINVSCQDVTGYAFYTMGASASDRNCRYITFNNCRSKNSNVDFEQQFSEYITLIDCWAERGDNDIYCEACYHPQYSRHIKHDRCYGFNTSGTVVNILGDVVLTIDITFTDCWFEHLGGAATANVVTTVAAGSHSLRLVNCDIISRVGSSIAIVTGSNWEDGSFVGCRIVREVNATIGNSLNNFGSSKLLIVACQLKITNASTGTVEAGSGTSTNVRYIASTLEAYSGGVANAWVTGAYYDPSCEFTPAPPNPLGGFGPNIANMARMVATGATLSTVDGRTRITNTATFGRATIALPTVIGKKYRVSWVSLTGNNTPNARITNNEDGSGSIISLTAQYPNGKSVEFEATATTTYFNAHNNSAGVDMYHDIENISVQEKY